MAQHESGVGRCLAEQFVVMPPCGCGEYKPADGGKSDTIKPEDRKLAEWLIKQHQRMIHEIRERYGLKA